MKPVDPHKIERFIHQALDNLPPIAAPASLENRVLGAIAAMESRPWWRKSISHWPSPVRAVFFVVTSALAAGTIWAMIQSPLSTPVFAVGRAVSAPLVWWSQVQAAYHDLRALLSPAITETVVFWINAGLGLLVVFYAFLFAIGATAYRALWRSS